MSLEALRLENKKLKQEVSDLKQSIDSMKKQLNQLTSSDNQEKNETGGSLRFLNRVRRFSQ